MLSSIFLLPVSLMELSLFCTNTHANSFQWATPKQEAGNE